MIEREVKLGAWAGMAVPDLAGVADGLRVVPAPPLRLNATYYDTSDLRLARWGVTLRHRSSEPAGKDGLPWTVKFPAEAKAGELARKELSFAGPEGRVPAALTDLVKGQSRGAPLAPIARLRTERTRLRLVDAAGTPVVEIDDDEVSVLVAGPTGRRRLAARFREIEAELVGDADPAILGAVVAALRAAGAGAPDKTPKLVRALGPQALAPPDVAPPDLGADSTIAHVIRAAIAAAAVRMISHDHGVRLGDDPEDVHQARVATRRLRSDLRTFRTLLDEEWAGGLREELGWYAALLGDVRDTDVLLERLSRQADDLPPADKAAAAALLKTLSGHRADARVALLKEMASPRYTDLLDRLVAAAAAPVFVAPLAPDPLVVVGRPLPYLTAPGPPEPSHDRPEDRALPVLPALVRKPWAHLLKAVDELGPEPADDDLHQVRIRAKRCRYAAEAVAPVMGKQARTFAAAVAELQGVLGDFHDAIVAEEWLRAAAARTSAARAVAAGQLIAVERAEARAMRKQWKGAWKVASAKKLRTWM